MHAKLLHPVKTPSSHPAVLMFHGYTVYSGDWFDKLGYAAAGFTVACASLEPRIKRAVPLFPFLSDYLRVWEMDHAKDAYKELQEYFRHSDPTHELEATIFEKLGYIDIQFLAPRARAKVVWGIGLMDIICPPSTQFAVYNKLTAPKKWRSTRILDMNPCQVGRIKLFNSSWDCRCRFGW